MQAQWTCIVLAGQRPGVDALADNFGISWKALVPLRGEPMITHVIRSLRRSPYIGKIIVLTQSVAALEDAVLAGGGAEITTSENSISLSIKKVVETLAFVSPVLVTTADHPLLTPAMIEEFVQNANGDLAIAMVEQKTMIARFPDAKRTWLRFSDGAWSGANLFALMSDKSLPALDLWAEAEQDRKKAWRLFLHFGFYLAFRAITRTIGLQDALTKAGNRLGLVAKLVPMSDPVAAIDVDKVSDHILAESILAQRSDEVS
jgi:GTP:adenosylcobinamide-phosphate guanylyltransferase